MNARTLIAPGRVMGPDPLSHREPSGELDRGERLAWWREARLGVFVHWCGSGLGHEISFSRGREVPAREYDAACRRLDPTAFDADALAGLAAESGAGYLVFVTKHADGFCWWPSEFTDHSVASTPAGRDIVGEVAAACGRAGLQFCCYHSIADWYHRDWPVGIDPNGQPKRTRDIDAYEAHLHRQVGELIQRYGPLGTLWFDAEWEWPWTHERGLRLYSHCRALQPDLIINDRVDISRQGSKGPSTGSVPPAHRPRVALPRALRLLPHAPPGRRLRRRLPHRRAAPRGALRWGAGRALLYLRQAMVVVTRRFTPPMVCDRADAPERDRHRLQRAAQSQPRARWQHPRVAGGVAEAGDPLAPRAGRRAGGGLNPRT